MKFFYSTCSPETAPFFKMWNYISFLLMGIFPETLVPVERERRTVLSLSKSMWFDVDSSYRRGLIVRTRYSSFGWGRMTLSFWAILLYSAFLNNINAFYNHGEVLTVSSGNIVAEYGIA